MKETAWKTEPAVAAYTGCTVRKRGGRVRSACFLLLTQSGTSRMALHTFKAGPSLVKPFPEVGLLGDSKAHQAEKINHHSILKRVLNIAV